MCVFSISVAPSLSPSVQGQSKALGEGPYLEYMLNDLLSPLPDQPH